MIKEKENKNPLLCDNVDGVCQISDRAIKKEIAVQNIEKPIKIVYFTDPICSSCWGIEPQMRRMKLEYGNSIEIEYRMGGLLPDWSYNDGNISKPSDVAHHWDEASAYYDMPIDGDIWLEYPLYSSYPPSIAFKAAQMQDEEKADLFLREIREMVFLQKKNITKWEHLENAAKKAGLNAEQLKIDYYGKAETLFKEDLLMARRYGVRGFPTLFFFDNFDNKQIVYGSKPYTFFEKAILKLYPSAAKNEYPKNWEALFSIHHSLTAREFSELSETSRAESEEILNKLTSKEKLEKFSTKNGAIWTIKKELTKPAT